ncbi:choice-of-anchor N protein [Candidatus Desantisbacteria bacterium]|nr:choice-of-anchor N protein [Candidatus Desantisbacteria bacterium]
MNTKAKGKKMKRIIFFITVFFLIILPGTSSVFAIPQLQLYIENSSYNNETWQITSPEFNLWVVGDVEKKGIINDVNLVTAFSSSETGSIEFTPIQTMLYPDPSLPGNPLISRTGSDSPPVMGGDEKLPEHGVYVPGVSWTTYELDDFDLMDSPVKNYCAPDEPSSTGQINAYKVKVIGYTWVHFDAFGTIIGKREKKDYIFAPFSHDAGKYPPVPEPSTIFLFGSGLAGLILFYKKRL